MRLRTSGHDFELPIIKYEFNKRNFIVQSLFNIYDFVFYYIIFILFLLYTCANVICIKFLLTYLVTPKVIATKGHLWDNFGAMCTRTVSPTRSCVTAEGPRDAIPVENISSYAQLNEKSHFKRFAIGAWPWKSLKVIGNGTVREAIYYFLLMVSSNNIAILYRFRDIITFKG